MSDMPAPSNIPIPDPTLLTTQQLLREIASVREIFETKLNASAVALEAAKESVAEQNRAASQAVAKAEVATIKQLDQIGITINVLASNLNDKIDDLKSRLNLIEGRSKGGAEIVGYIFGGIALFISAGTLLSVLLHK